jgi:hypothetical protein
VLVAPVLFAGTEHGRYRLASIDATPTVERVADTGPVISCCKYDFFIQLGGGNNIL